jgi:hypothetical protein
MTTEERIAAIRADLNGASGVFRNGERIRSAHAHLDAIQARIHSLTEAAQVAADALEEMQEPDWTQEYREKTCGQALSLLSQNGVVPGGG